MDDDDLIAIGALIMIVLGLSASDDAGGGGELTPDVPDQPDQPPPPGPDEPEPKVVKFIPPGQTPTPPNFNPVAPVGPKIEQPKVPPLGELVRPYPTPGSIYSVGQGDMFGGTNSDRSIAYRALLTAGFMAAQHGGLGDEEAREFARTVAKNPQLRARYIQLIQCVPLNERLYGTYGWGSNAVPNANNRAIRLVPQHADNIQRMQKGQPLIRNIRWGDENRPGDGSAVGVVPEFRTSYEDLWLPAVDLPTLWASAGQTLEVQPSAWPNGLSGMWPPEWILDLGVEDYSGAPFEDVGCLGAEAEVLEA